MGGRRAPASRRAKAVSLDQDIRPMADEPDPSEAAEDPIDPGFDEAAYLRAFPDIAEAVRRGALPSGLAHFRASGKGEGRLDKPEYRVLRETNAGPAAPPVTLDTLTVSRSGAVLMTGWTDDRYDALTEISLETRDGARAAWTIFPRLIRPDVQRAIDSTAPPHRFGFFVVASVQEGTAEGAMLTANAPSFRFASGAHATPVRPPVLTGDAELRDLILTALPAALGGEDDPDSIRGMLDQDLGVRIATLNRAIVEQAKASRYVERIGASRGRYRGTVITSLRGPVEQMAARLALIATGPGAEMYEFVHVVTDQDQFEPALRAAHVAEKTLGVPQTVVLHPGGDPAAAGEDAAADIARSDRLIFMDQTVFPRSPDWASRHSALLADAPEAQTKLFGGLLYHADGSLAQGGYRFDQHTSLAARGEETPRQVRAVRMNRVTHPAPAAASALREAHAIAGTPAAFLSVDRAWFEHLGGFTRPYARAALEDIDLCLRALRQGSPAWVHPLDFWYFERRGQPRPEPSRGGALLNEWLFHRQWNALILSTLPGGGG